MNTRVQTLIADLQLQPHPEGGYYREIFRSERLVLVDGKHTVRSALTSIYFLLEAGQQSRWHRVESDEAWSHLEGDVLELYSFDADSAQGMVSRLGPYASGTESTRVIPAGIWQAARPLGAYTLVTCSVGPGFDFIDFSMIDAHPAVGEAIRAQGELFASLI
jgi:predicted cupin superfamily sugar epimerase